MSYMYQSEKTQNVSEIIVYKLSKQKRFFVDVRPKSLKAQYLLMTFECFAIFSSPKQYSNSYLVIQKRFRLLQFSWTETAIYV